MGVAILSLSVLSLLEISTQTYKLGEDFDPVRYQATPKVASLTRGSFDELPAKASLMEYAPLVGNQKNSGSCVGWASAYSAASIAWAITVEQAKDHLNHPGPFSPAFVFNRIKASNDCEGGSNIESALNDLTYNGTLPLAAFPYSDSQCKRTPTDTEFEQAEQFVIEGYRRLSSVNSTRSLHIAVRRALVKKNPVVIGMIVGPSFMSYKNTHNTLRISTEDNELYDRVGRDAMYKVDGFGGHAMTVVAYDDNRDGGAFLIMNSWGSSWGTNGFVWVKYSDFIRWVRSAYEIIPQIPEEPESKTPDFNGSIELKGFRQQSLPLIQTANGLSLQTPLYSGARLRAEVSVSTDSYVYVIGTDDTTSKHVVLFPQLGEVSPLVSAGDTILLPGPTEDFYTRLDQNSGTDYLIVLHSRNKLDVRKLAQNMDASIHRDLHQRLMSASNGRLVPLDQVSLTKIGNYEAVVGNDGILAMIIDIKHLDKPYDSPDKTGPNIVITSPEIENTDAYVDGDTVLRYASGDEVIVKGIAQDESEIVELDVTNAFDIKFSSRGPFVARVDLTDITVGSSKTIIVRSRDQYKNESSQSITISRVKP
ncbi:C1 family peptidase [Pseudoalteromonas lipolytica]|uniref:C1 family peptidase n=1 Tax=Pseudoalteromonas lipolytica TaxID=570156 RepID=UPI003BA02FD8